ncbi:MAG: PucR family transcriptional regulator [Acutalibacteraceae bacterium]
MALQLGKLYSRVKEKCNDDEIELIAGEKGLDKVVRWMHMVEGVEIARFLEGDEVAFTTGIALKSDDELFELVREAYVRGASGIVINLGPYIRNIPQQIINFCNENSMPLFRMPWQAHMAHIMKFFAEEITMAEKRSLELISAVKNAINFSASYDLYVPTLEHYGYLPEWKYCIAVCECTTKTGGEVEQNLLENLMNGMEALMAMEIQNTVVFRIENQIVTLFCNTEDEHIETAINHVINALSPSLRETVNIYIGIGRNTKNVQCIHKTYSIAAKAAHLQKKREIEGKAAAYRSMGAQQLLLLLDEPEIMHEFYEETLEPLVKYDELNHTDLVGFMRSYFTYGGRVKETAEGMFLHRNSINYKLRKIEEILHCDFSDINAKLRILIAIEIMDLM